MKAVAEHVAFTRSHGNDVVVAVSAMGKATDNLIALANSVSRTQPGREMDMLLTTGERVSAALLTMALADLGVEAVSFTGSQVGIITDTVHGKAKIVEVKGDRVREALAAGKVCVVAGFQGVSTEREITTLGRGGTDTTAVALAAALGADACEIYTDVTGVFTADPRIVPQARKLARVHFDEMLEMAGAGSKVLALRSVEFARNHNVPIHVRSSFTWEQGTWVNFEEPGMEDPIISGVVTDANEAKVTVLGVPDQPGVSAALFEPLAARNVVVDMIVQNTSTEGHTDISFTVPKADMTVSEQIVGQVRGRDRRQGRHPRRRHRQGVDRRRRHEDLARHRRQDVPHARRRGRQHRDDLDVDDPHLGRGRRHPISSGRPAACTPRSASTRGQAYAAPSPNALNVSRSWSGRATISVLLRLPRLAHLHECLAGHRTSRGGRLGACPSRWRAPTTSCRETGWVFNNEVGDSRRWPSSSPPATTRCRPTSRPSTCRTPDDDARTLVEIGSGIGRMTCAFTREFGSVIACDLDAGFLERCYETVGRFGKVDRLRTRPRRRRPHARPPRRLRRPRLQLHHAPALPPRRRARARRPRRCASCAPAARIALNFRHPPPPTSSWCRLGAVVRASFRIPSLGDRLAARRGLRPVGVAGQPAAPRPGDRPACATASPAIEVWTNPRNHVTGYGATQRTPSTASTAPLVADRRHTVPRLIGRPTTEAATRATGAERPSSAV